MAKNEFVLNIGDDNVVLSRVVDGKIANAWLASPDPAMATEELGEAFAEDKKCKISVLIDTLDQTLRDEEIPKVGVLDRRKVLGRHVNMAFPGANLRGARMIEATKNNTMLYQFAAIPLEGRLLGWVDFVDSLPNDSGGYFALAAENIDMLAALAPKDAPAVEQGNHWRHFIGVNATGGLRQIIEKNGRLCLTRLTQAPPPDTPPGEFADMIIRDFKATITYIRRLGYAVGEPLDLVILTTGENKAALDALTWEGARSVSLYTPYEAALYLGLGSIGREDQAFCDVLHAAWFSAKRKASLPLTRAATLGNVQDDLRDIAYIAAPYAAAVLVAGVLGWTGWTGWDTYQLSQANDQLTAQLGQVKRSLSTEEAQLASLPYDAARMRNVLDVNKAMETGKVDLDPVLRTIASALQSDAIVLTLGYTGPGSGPGGAARQSNAAYTLTVRMRLADVIVKADEAVQVSRKLLQRMSDAFGKGYKVDMVAEPAAAQAGLAMTGNLLGGPSSDNAGPSVPSKERFYTEFRISKAAS